MQVNDRRLGFGRQIIANLGQLCLDLRQRSVGVVVKLQVHCDCADSLGARRLHVVDTVRAGNDALDRRSDKSANQVRISADINRRDLHHRDVAARILTHTQRSDGLQPGNQDYQAHDDRENWPLYKEIRELHF